MHKYAVVRLRNKSPMSPRTSILGRGAMVVEPGLYRSTRKFSYCDSPIVVECCIFTRQTSWEVNEEGSLNAKKFVDSG
jgi:hypothetical protein